VASLEPASDFLVSFSTMELRLSEPRQAIVCGLPAQCFLEVRNPSAGADGYARRLRLEWLGEAVIGVRFHRLNQIFRFGPSGVSNTP
jgi:hypothetical protein